MLRWYKFINVLDSVKNTLASLPTTIPTTTDTATAATQGGKTRAEGKFVDLPGAEMGKVVVRFPPEASG